MAEGQPPTERADDSGVRQVGTVAEARALANPLRLRILRLTAEVPLTNRELADRLGRDPATVLHHVRLLVDTGFLAAEPARRGTRGAREIPYRATGKSWRLDFGDEQSRPLGDALLATFLEELREAGGVLEHTTRAALRLTPAERDELSRRVYEIVEELRNRHRGRPPAEAERWSLFFAMHRQA